MTWGQVVTKEVAQMTTAVVDILGSEETQAWWFLDTLVIEHRCAPQMNTVVLEHVLGGGGTRDRRHRPSATAGRGRGDRR